jgi:hypothetical protein
VHPNVALMFGRTVKTSTAGLTAHAARLGEKVIRTTQSLRSQHVIEWIFQLFQELAGWTLHCTTLTHYLYTLARDH